VSKQDKISIVVFGPGPQFKGGIANYTVSLARALDGLRATLPQLEVHIVSWTQQYPAIIPRDFIDRKSSGNLLAGTGITVHYLTNYNNPATWAQTVRLVRKLNPAKVIFQWAIALQGLPMGWMARRLRKHTQAEIIFDLHLVRQKEASMLDSLCTRYALPAAHTYIVHALQTAQELQALFPNHGYTLTKTGERVWPNAAAKPVLALYHPIYDLFKPQPGLDVAAEKARLRLRKHVFLFFGFIRKYKGLHYCIEAFAKLARERDDVSLLVVGESFWQTLDQTKWSTRVKSTLFGWAKKLFLRGSADERDYRPLELIEKLGIQDRVAVVNEFVPNEDVHRYFQVSDAILLFYETATPSGVESLSYNFLLPVLATRVGHFEETIRDGYNGYLARAAEVDDMAAVMRKFLTQPINRNNIAEATRQMSWHNYARAIMQAELGAAE
jgi:glycosyltransferase involved in cell wall biosynthesis